MNTKIEILKNADKVLKAVFDYYKDGFFSVDFEAIACDKEPVKVSINDKNCADKVLPQLDYELLPYELISKKEIFIETIVYLYGLWFYKKITGQNYEYILSSDLIKTPGVFQLLSSVLKEDYTQRESDYFMLKTYIDIALDENNDNFFHFLPTNEYDIEAFSSVGLLRDENQDSFYYFQDTTTKSLLLIVADGMGGGDFGKEASTIAINIFKQEFDNLSQLAENDVDDYLKETILKINKTILIVIKNRNLKSMGTTVSAVFIKNNRVFFGHVGDSRIYVKYRNEKKFKPITQDHSFVEVEFRKGNITEEEKKKYKKNILAYVVGSKNLTRDVINTTKDYSPICLNDIESLALCSDGVWDLMNDEYWNYDIKRIYKELNKKITHDNFTLIKLNRKEKNYGNENLENKNSNDFPVLKKNYKITEEEKNKIPKYIFLLFFSILIVGIGSFYFENVKINASIDKNVSNANLDKYNKLIPIVSANKSISIAPYTQDTLIIKQNKHSNKERNKTFSNSNILESITQKIEQEENRLLQPVSHHP